jgi:hypothetical protein
VIQSYGIRKIVFHMNDHYFEYDPMQYTTNHESFGELSVRHKYGIHD